MHNVTHKMQGSKLIIEVDLSKQNIDAAPPSSTGKTRLVASTGGPVELPAVNGRVIKFALNVTTK
jgi:hypothetical protein